MTGILLVGFKPGDTKYTKETALCTMIGTQEMQIIPQYTELAAFETVDGKTRVFYAGQYAYLSQNVLTDYKQIMPYNPAWTGDTVIEDHTDSSQIMLLGDSRIVQMRTVVDASMATWIAEAGAGYTWLSNVAAPIVDNMDIQGKRIYLMMGINDLIYTGMDSDKSYVNFLQSKAQEWEARGASVVFVSVNPIQYHGWITNETIHQYNEEIRTKLPENIEYLDMYTQLGNWGQYGTIDGLHYNAQTYQMIYGNLW